MDEQSNSIEFEEDFSTSNNSDTPADEVTVGITSSETKRSKRAIQRKMTMLGYKKIEETPDRVVYKKGRENHIFSDFKEIEDYLEKNNAFDKPEKRTTKKTRAKRTVKPKAEKVATTKEEKSVSVKNWSNDDFVVIMNDKKYTANRLKRMAIDTYRYDMDGKEYSEDKVTVFLIPEQNKCKFIIDDNIEGEFTL